MFERCYQYYDSYNNECLFPNAPFSLRPSNSYNVVPVSFRANLLRCKTTT